MCVGGGHLSHLSFCTMLQNIWPLAETLCECGSLGLVSTETFLYHMTITWGILINFFFLRLWWKISKTFLSTVAECSVGFSRKCLAATAAHTKSLTSSQHSIYTRNATILSSVRHVWTPFHDVFFYGSSFTYYISYTTILWGNIIIKYNS